MENNRRLEQINLSIGGIIIIILLLFHSIYLLLSEKKQILGIDTLSSEKFITQALVNRIIAFFVVLMFFCFSLENYYNSEKPNNEGLLRVIISSLALLATTIEIYLNLKNFVSLEQE